MPNEPRLQTKDILLRAPEPQYRSCQETSPRAHTISTMTTTTFTASTVTSASCLGSYAVFEDGTPRGVQRQIERVVGTTATLDAAVSASTGVTTIRTWLPADVPWRVTTSGAATVVTSSPHQSITNEPDDYFINRGGFMMRKLAGSGACAKVTDFVSSTGVATVDALPAVTSVGDLFLYRELLRPEAPAEVSLNAKTLARRVVGFQHADQAVPITTEANISFVLPQRPITASAPNAVAATPPLEMGSILTDVMTQTLDTGSTVSSATATTVVAASGTGFTIGGFALLNTGEAFQILNKATNTLTVQSGLISDTVAAGTLYASSWYKHKTSDWRTCMFDLYRGRLRRQILHGCMPTIAIDISRDQVVRFNLAYMMGDAGLDYNQSDPIPTATVANQLPLIDTTVPTDGKAARICIDGVKCLLGTLSMNLGFKPAMRMSLSGVNQGDGCFMDVEPVTGSMTILADQDDTASFKALGDRLRGGDTVNMLYQKGSAPTETFCIGIPAMQLTQCNFAYNNGQGELQINFTAVLPDVVRNNSFADGLPTVAIGYM